MLATFPVKGVYEDRWQVEIKMEKFAQFFVEVTRPPKMMFIELLLLLSLYWSFTSFHWDADVSFYNQGHGSIGLPVLKMILDIQIGDSNFS